MRRFLVLVIAVAIGLVAVAADRTGAHAQSATIAVTPASGTQFDTFTFTGQGFAPGTQLGEAYVSPDGETFTFFIGDQQAVIVVDDDGIFSVDVHPNVDFQGAREGTWTVVFCVVGSTTDCWTGTIDIAA